MTVASPWVITLFLQNQHYPAAIPFEAANPRHEHEWRVFEAIELPTTR